MAGVNGTSFPAYFFATNSSTLTLVEGDHSFMVDKFVPSSESQLWFSEGLACGATSQNNFFVLNVCETTSDKPGMSAVINDMLENSTRRYQNQRALYGTEHGRGPAEISRTKGTAAFYGVQVRACVIIRAPATAL